MNKDVNPLVGNDSFYNIIKFQKSISASAGSQDAVSPIKHNDFLVY